jgi:hypothetical protein
MDEKRDNNSENVWSTIHPLHHFHNSSTPCTNLSWIFDRADPAPHFMISLRVNAEQGFQHGYSLKRSASTDSVS